MAGSGVGAAQGPGAQPDPVSGSPRLRPGAAPSRAATRSRFTNRRASARDQLAGPGSGTARDLQMQDADVITTSGPLRQWLTYKSSNWRFTLGQLSSKW